MKVLSVVVLFLATTFAGAGQATKQTVTEPMKALNFLVGKWQGKVKYEPGVQQHPEAFVTLNAHYNMGGSILIIDEKANEIENRNNTIVEILVVIYWDQKTKAYPARLYWSSKAGAGSVEAKSQVQDNTLVLQTGQPGGAINRYTLWVDEKGQWHEIGESSNDGGSWKKRFEITLNRQDQDESRGLR